MQNNKIKKIVKDKYQDIATKGTCCGCGCKMGNQDIAKSIGYSDQDLATVGEANLGLGCGNPVAISSIKPGDTVLDLGSGAGLDCFLAAKKVGPEGKVIGVDMTEEMVERAKKQAAKDGYNNAEFVLGDIEDLLVDDNSVDIVISNCVINLAPDKAKVFSEIYRVLKPGGKMFISDIVLLAELTEEQKKDPELLSGCVAGAVIKADYIEFVRTAGFKVNILNENKEIAKKQYKGIALESLMLEGEK